MSKYSVVASLVLEQYDRTSNSFASWMRVHHVPVVAKYAEELSVTHGAKADLAVAGAWLHDYADAFVHRFDPDHEKISKEKATEVLQQAGYQEDEVTFVLEEVIAPHSCKNSIVPTTLEGKVLATADAMAHLSTDFYVQFCWMHLPEGKNYEAFIEWVKEKLRRDFEDKIFFEEVRKNLTSKYNSLTTVFGG